MLSFSLPILWIALIVVSFIGGLTMLAPRVWSFAFCMLCALVDAFLLYGIFVQVRFVPFLFAIAITFGFFWIGMKAYAENHGFSLSRPSTWPRLKYRGR